MKPPTRRGSPRRPRLARIAVCALALMLPALHPPSFAQQPAASRDAAQQPVRKANTGRPAANAASHYWYDGDRRRELLLEPARVADFRPAAADRRAESASRGAAGGRTAASRTPLRAAHEIEKDPSNGLPPGVSPVLRDAEAPARLRSLAGGVIVTLRMAPAGNDAAARETQARRQLVAAGLEPLRAIDPEARRWLVESPVGLESLELANRLHESGDFESAAPNWWQPRALK